MRQIKALLITLLLAFVLTGCGDKQEDDSKDTIEKLDWNFVDTDVIGGDPVTIEEDIRSYLVANEYTNYSVLCEVVPEIPNSGFWDTSVPGTYEVKCTVTDADGDTSEKTATLTVSDIPDRVGPVITGFEDRFIEFGITMNLDDGIRFMDDTDGDITFKAACTVEDEDGDIAYFSTESPGVYMVTCSASDSSGNTTEETHTFTVLEELDTNPPVFYGFDDVTVEFGAHFNHMEGVTAIDAVDGDLTSQIVCDEGYETGPDETAQSSGVYTSSCSCTDTDDFTTTVTRTIIILDERVGPVISGPQNILVPMGDYFNPVFGMEAIDKKDGDVTDNVTVELFYSDTDDQPAASIDTSVPISYDIKYSVTNSLGIETELRIRVDVYDNVPPVMIVDDIEISTNFGFDNFADFVTVTDNLDGVIETIEYTIYDLMMEDVEYDPLMYGDFTIEYTASDDYGNITAAVVALHIVDNITPVVTVYEETVIVFPGDPLDIAGNFTYSDDNDDNLVLDVIYVNALTFQEEAVITTTDYGEYVITLRVTDPSGNYYSMLYYLTLVSDSIVTQTLSLMDAQQQLQSFYTNMHIDQISPMMACSYFEIGQGEESPPATVMTFDECMSKIGYWRNEMISISVGDTIETGVDSYESLVTFTTIYGTYVYQVTYSFLGYEFSPWVTIDFTEDPFTYVPAEIVFDQDLFSAEYRIDNYYSNIVHPTQPDEDIYYYYITTNYYDETSFEEFMIEINNVRSTVIDYRVDKVEAVIIPQGEGPEINGFKATVELMTATQSRYVEVYYAFVILTEIPLDVIMIYSDPGGDGLDDFILLSETEAETELTTFYDEMLGTGDVTQFCYDYYLVNEHYELDLPHCITYVEFVRSQNITYTITNLTQTQLVSAIGFFTGYNVTISFVDEGTTSSITLPVGFGIDVVGRTYVLFMDPYLVNLKDDQELNYAALIGRESSALLNGFYDDLVNEELSNTEFCNSWELKDDLWKPLDEVDCSLIRNLVIGNDHVYVITQTAYLNQRYEVTLLRDGSLTYTSYFTIVYDPIGVLHVSVILEEAAGGTD